MSKKKSERQHKLSAIEGALKLAQEINADALIRNDDMRYGGLMELNDQLKAGLEAVQWLRDYPDSLLEPLATLEHDQFHSWCQIYLSKVGELTREIWRPGLVQYAYAPGKFKIAARSWAGTVINVFKTGTVDLRRES